VGYYFALLLLRLGRPSVPRNYLNSKYNLSIHLIAKYFREPGAGSREPGAGDSGQWTVKDELKASRRQLFVRTQKSLPEGRLFSFFHPSSEYQTWRINTPKKIG
jgi:hypothetical protein